MSMLNVSGHGHARNPSARASRSEHWLRHAAVIALAIVVLPLSTASAIQLKRADDVTASAVDVRLPGAAPFSFDGAASSVLFDMWRESVDLNQELVACMRGEYRDGVVQITGVRPVNSMANFTGAEAAPSLERCGPPQWSGTVHTHIAVFNGLPYATFSPADRGVMRAWELKWKTEGLFCVLYTDDQAYCEYGEDLSGDVPYVDTVADASAAGGN